MAAFHELTKNFNKCRDYVRDFFVYGFKSRMDFTSDRKSARTYDDERRRITSWLSDYVIEDMTEKSHLKNISLQIDSNLLDTNPLFSVWKTKSFTDNDILLHFFLLDILGGLEYSYNCNQPLSADSGIVSSESLRPAYSAGELADILSEEYSFTADTQLVRRKCNEYVKEGLFEIENEKKTILYKTGLAWDDLLKCCAQSADNHSKKQSPNFPMNKQTINKTSHPLTDAILLFQLTNPFGFVGNTILEKLDTSNDIFRVKHSFPTFTLEEEIAYSLLNSQKNRWYIKMDIMSNKTGQTSHPIYGIPLKIFVSTRTGRRYICIYHMIHKKSQPDDCITEKYRFQCIRLDQIKAVTVITSDSVTENKQKEILSTIGAYENQDKILNKYLPMVWGVSFEGTKTKVVLTLCIDEKNEDFILNRLDREGKNGTVTRITDNTFLYEKIVFDANEMFPWLRTFIGRIIDIHFITLNRNEDDVRENLSLRKQFLDDIYAMENMYL